MKVLTKQEVLKRIENFCKPYTTFKAAADALGCTQSQLSDARNDRAPVAPAILKKLKIDREPLYVTEMENKYRDGSMSF